MRTKDWCKTLNPLIHKNIVDAYAKIHGHKALAVKMIRHNVKLLIGSGAVTKFVEGLEQ